MTNDFESDNRLINSFIQHILSIHANPKHSSEVPTPTTDSVVLKDASTKNGTSESVETLQHVLILIGRHFTVS